MGREHILRNAWDEPFSTQSQYFPALVLQIETHSHVPSHIASWKLLSLQRKQKNSNVCGERERERERERTRLRGRTMKLQEHLQ